MNKRDKNKRLKGFGIPVEVCFPNVDRARGFAKECAKAQAQAGAHGREFVICELVPRETVKWEGGES